MQQFDLDKWLQDKSRKVVTRDGRQVRIICWDKENTSSPIVFLIKDSEEGCSYEYINCADIEGKADIMLDDLFFADEEDKLTEFEKEVAEAYEWAKTTEREEFVNEFAPKLLDLARTELQPDFDEEMERMLAETDKVVYQKVQQDVLKSLPKWKKATEHKEFDKHVCVMDYYMFPFLDTEVNEGDYYIELSDLKVLPKEE